MPLGITEKRQKHFVGQKQKSMSSCQQSNAPLAHSWGFKMIVLKKNVLKAALISAPKNDVRYYLNAVFLRVAESGKVYIASTDGHRLFLANVPANWTGEAQPAFDLIIPRATVDSAVKAGGDSITLSAMPDGRYTLGDEVFARVDGIYPNINAVIPSSTSGELAQFNPDYLADAQKALCLVTGRKNSVPFLLHHNGQSAAYMSCGDALVVIMPHRTDKCDKFPSFKAY
jgi:DNA polymerase III sliding clamp (beta) subunit (PCNA family)